MKGSIEYVPDHNMFILEDSGGGSLPDIDERLPRIWATETCVIIGCLVRDEGKTRLVLSNSLEDAPDEPPVFMCDIATPSYILQVIETDLSILMQMETAATKTKLRVWTNHASEPDEITVLLS